MVTKMMKSLPFKINRQLQNFYLTYQILLSIYKYNFFSTVIVSTCQEKIDCKAWRVEKEAGDEQTGCLFAFLFHVP